MQESAIPEDTTKDPQLLSRHDRYGDESEGNSNRGSCGFGGREKGCRRVSSA